MKKSKLEMLDFKENQLDKKQISAILGGDEYFGGNSGYWKEILKLNHSTGVYEYVLVFIYFSPNGGSNGNPVGAGKVSPKP